MASAGRACPLGFTGVTVKPAPLPPGQGNPPEAGRNAWGAGSSRGRRSSQIPRSPSSCQMGFVPISARVHPGAEQRRRGVEELGRSVEMQRLRILGLTIVRALQVTGRWCGPASRRCFPKIRRANGICRALCTHRGRAQHVPCSPPEPAQRCLPGRLSRRPGLRGTGNDGPVSGGTAGRPADTWT